MTDSDTTKAMPQAPVAVSSSATERWEALAHAIAQSRSDHPVEAVIGGELVVIGSGFSLIDFTADSEEQIKSADEVFYCLYDNITKSWLLSIRPDALDLTALYNQEIDRYWTYVQMAEALLYHVRRGKRVVAIYYGHPGIFATPAHRAIQIARREQYPARMRPGISALDYLVADVGFDPAIPGLMSYEATDMLLRRRTIDTSLHIVLWQVGVVGEFGFKAEGFENKGFNLFVDELERAYGSEWEVTHYIASRFATVDPVIERFRIGDLRQQEVRGRINALSTFYIEPKTAVPTDPSRSVELGLTQLGDPIQPPSRAYDNSTYGPLEEAALRQFDWFRASPETGWDDASPAMDFMLAISLDAALRRRFLHNPNAVLAEEPFANLSERTKRLLSIPHSRSVEAALLEEAQRARATDQLR